MAIIPFTPVGNTPENALIRGESFYYLNETITQSDVLQFNAPIVAAYVAANSQIDLVTLSFWNKDGAPTFNSLYYISQDCPFVGAANPTPLNVIPGADTAQSMVRIYPTRTLVAGQLNMLLFFKSPSVAPTKRTNNKQIVSLYTDITAGATILSAFPSMGRRKVSFILNMTSATVVTIQIYASMSYYTPALKTLVYTYTTTGAVGDGFVFVFDNHSAAKFITIVQVAAAGSNSGYIDVEASDD